MASLYDLELQKLPTTYKHSVAEDISKVTDAIAGASESSIIGVGSGGSYTLASLLCHLHESYTGRVSRAATSLELICNPTLAASSPVFLFSAEGKNPDIVEALRRAREQTSRNVHVFTNRSDSPLVQCAYDLTNVCTIVFDLREKDGYLATNSLLFDAVIIARAYGELDRLPVVIPSSIDGLHLNGHEIRVWLDNHQSFIADVVSRGALLIVYSPLLRPVAADLESKLSEAALLHCQLADLRSFAHGRHLWLAARPAEIALLALVEPNLRELWTRMTELIPKSVPIAAMPFHGTTPSDLLAGLVAQMWLVSAISACSGTDPGHPDVPQFGREIHYLDVQQLISSATASSDHGEASKHEVLGANWPSAHKYGPVHRALATYATNLQKQRFRAIIFDYDGTLCPSGSSVPPPPAILDRIQRLLLHDVVVGIASGRGGSVREDLQQSLDSSLWPRIPLALYGGGWLTAADADDTQSNIASEFLSHVTRIVYRLKALGVPIQTVRVTLPYQVSVRFREGVPTDQMWFVIADALRQAGLDTSRVQRSAHSVDILASGVSKAMLIDSLIQEFAVHPHEILTMGDQGAWPGNDYSLLEHRFSLSVDLPSRRLDRGWKLTPRHMRGVDATLWYLDRVHLCDGGGFSIDLGTALAAISGGLAT